MELEKRRWGWTTTNHETHRHWLQHMCWGCGGGGGGGVLEEGGGGGGKGEGRILGGGGDKWKTAGRVSGCRVARVFPEERKPATAVKLPFPSLPLCQHLGWPEEEGTKLPLQCRQLLGEKTTLPLQHNYLFNTECKQLLEKNYATSSTQLPFQHRQLHYLFNTDYCATSSTQTTKLTNRRKETTTFLKQRSGAILAPWRVFCRKEGQQEGFIRKPANAPRNIQSKLWCTSMST